jgi:predicted membrane-bound spermidine synthase
MKPASFSHGRVMAQTVVRTRQAHPRGEAPLTRKGQKKLATLTASRPAPGTRGFATLLSVSGFVALVYETLWVRQLGRVVGVEVHAVTIALSAFFAGLALGGAALGRLADRAARPLRLYALLEAGVAASGVLATLTLARSAEAFVALREAAGPLAWALPFVLVGLPSFLMGGTLPALVRALHPGDHDVAPATGLLYAANTAGAVAGTLATPFILVPALGIAGTGLFAGATGLGVAVAALAVARGRPPLAPAEPSPAQPSAAGAAHDARVALALYALAGAVALGYEVVWSELLVQFLSTRAHAFAVMLATYLTGLALGSFLFSRFSRAHHDAWRVFGLLLSCAGASAILVVAVLGAWLPDAQTFAGMWAMRFTGSETTEVLARFLVASSAVLLVPTTLLGAAFPAAARLAAGAERVGRDVGRVAALNTAGGIAGTLLTGFVLIPRLGIVRALGLLALGGATLGALAILRGRRTRAPTLAAALVLLALVLVAATPGDRLAHLLSQERGGRLVFYQEDVAGTVAVLEQGGRPETTRAFRRLYIQGVSNSGDAPPSLRYMRLQALLPLIVHGGEPRSALVVGLGTGITAGALLPNPGLERRVVAELLPSVVAAAAHFAGNFEAASDRRIEIRLTDGRHELLRRAERYDLVTLEPPPPSAAGVANLYSREFYALCRDRLEDGGLMAQWWPLPTQNDEDSRSLVRAFLDVFPHVSAWSTELHEALLVGSERPLALDGARIADRFATPEVKAALAEVGIESPQALLATWLTGREGLERYAGNVPPVTDDRPLIEHAAWVRRGEIRRVLPRILELASPVPLSPSEPLLPDVVAERQELHDFYRAAHLAMGGDAEKAARALRAVLGRDPHNPYYRFVAFGGR